MKSRNNSGVKERRRERLGDDGSNVRELGSEWRRWFEGDLVCGRVDEESKEEEEGVDEEEEENSDGDSFDHPICVREEAICEGEEDLVAEVDAVLIATSEDEEGLKGWWKWEG